MLRFELRALRNSCRTHEGRQALIGSGIVLGCLAIGGLAIGSMLTADELLPHLRDPNHPALAVVVAGLLLVSALLVVGFARGSCHNHLFAAAHVPAWLASPAGSTSLIAMLWLRHTGAALLTSLVLVGVPLLAVVVRAELHVWALIGFVVTLAALLGLLVAAVALALVLTTRFVTGRLRQVLGVAHVLFTTAVVIALLAGFGRGPDVRAWLAAAAPDPAAFGEIVFALASLSLAGAHATFATAAWVTPVALLLTTGTLLWATVRLYRPAFEAWLTATPIAPKRARGHDREWPQSPVRSLVRRGLLEVWRARSNLAAIALFGVLAAWPPATSVYTPVPSDAVPVLREVFFLLSPWQSLASILAMLLFLGVVGDEQKSVAVLATAPMSRADFLRSRIVLVAWPFAMTVVLVALAGLFVADVGVLAVVGYLLAAGPVVMVLLGATLVVGSWPAFIALHEQLPLASSVRSVVPVLALSVVAAVCMWAQYKAKAMLCVPESTTTAPGATALAIVAGAWAIGGLTIWGCCALARRNLERLLGPQ